MAEILYESVAGVFETVTFDVTIREGHTADTELPRHIVEASADTNDHVRVLPETLTLEAAVSNKPVRVPVSEFTGQPIEEVQGSQQSYSFDLTDYRLKKAGSVQVSEGLPVPKLGNLGAKPPEVTTAEWETFKTKIGVQAFTVETVDRVREVYTTLRGLRGVPCTVLTSLAQYDGLALRTVSAPVATKGYVAFTLDFERFQTSETETVALDPIEERGKPKVSAGAQAGYDPPAGTTSGARQVTETVQGWLNRDSRSARTLTGNPA